MAKGYPAQTPLVDAPQNSNALYGLMPVTNSVMW